MTKCEAFSSCTPCFTSQESKSLYKYWPGRNEIPKTHGFRNDDLYYAIKIIYYRSCSSIRAKTRHFLIYLQNRHL